MKVWDYNLGCEVEVIQTSQKPSTVRVNDMVFEIEELPKAWKVHRIKPISNRSHIVRKEGEDWICDCQWNRRLGRICNHIRAVQNYLKLWGEKND